MLSVSDIVCIGVCTGVIPNILLSWCICIACENCIYSRATIEILQGLFILINTVRIILRCGISYFEAWYSSAKVS